MSADPRPQNDVGFLIICACVCGVCVCVFVCMLKFSVRVSVGDDGVRGAWGRGGGGNLAEAFHVY